MAIDSLNDAEKKVLLKVMGVTDLHALPDLERKGYLKALGLTDKNQHINDLAWLYWRGVLNGTIPTSPLYAPSELETEVLDKRITELGDFRVLED